MRNYGTGSVTREGDRFRVRLPMQFGRKSLGLHPTEEQARGILAAALAELARGDARPTAGTALASYGERALDWREKRYRSTDSYRQIFERHIKRSAWASMSVSAFAPSGARSVVEWIGDINVAHQTRKNILTCVRAIFARAVEERLLPSNPFAGIELVKTLDDLGDDTEDGWTHLTLDEVERVLSPVPMPDRFIAALAIFTCLRQGEQWNLELRDVHLDAANPHIVVRYGSKGLPPKNGIIRNVPLFGLGLEGMRAWIKALPSFAKRNPEGLVFPGPRGCRRAKGKAKLAGRWWGDWVARAELGRPVRWHDLRHTGASLLLTGVYGRRWELIELRDLLGHGDIATTQRYAHLADSALVEAARETGRRLDGPIAKYGAAFEIRTRDLRFTKPAGNDAISSGSPPPRPDLDQLAREVLAAYGRGERPADALVIRLASEALTATEAAQAGPALETVAS